MRVRGWEKALRETVMRHRDTPGEWGVSDCWMLACDAHEAVTGEALAPDLRGYATERDGYRLFVRYGFTTVGQALAAHLQEIPRLTAQRGDLCVVERNSVESCGVVTSIGVSVKTEAGVEYLPVTDIKTAFRVG